MADRIGLSVRKLVEFVLKEGDLILDSFSSPSRLLDAQRMHRKLQKSRPAGYRSEVAVSAEIPAGTYLLEINGRLDGVYQDSSVTVIEEIKTTLIDPDLILTHEIPVHWAQAKIYACLFARSEQLSEIQVELTYVNLDTEKTASQRYIFSRTELEAFFDEIILRFRSWSDLVAAWQKKRDTSLLALEFPFPAYRRGQRELAVKVYQQIREEGQLLVSAPTGIGKTIAVLFSSLKAMGDSYLTRIFYLAARTTGKDIAVSALKQMQGNGLKIKYLILTAKEKLCFLPTASCNPEECIYARGYYDRIDDALKNLFEHDGLTREIIEEVSRKFQVCPFEFSLYASLWVDVIICDYNYVFDPLIRLKRFFSADNQEQDPAYVLLVDEAHNLVDRARDMFSASLSKKTILELRKRIKTQLPVIEKSLSDLNRVILKIRKNIPAETDFKAEQNLPEAIIPKLRKFMTVTENWLVKNIKTDFRQELLELYFEVNAFIRISEGFDEHYLSCYRKENRDFLIKLFCLNPANKLALVLNQVKAAVFFSATLTPVSYFRELFGCRENALGLILQSPFPAENLLVIKAGTISTRYRQRIATGERIAGIIKVFCDQKQGNYLIFLPSYQYLELIKSYFDLSAAKTEIIFQQPGMTESARSEFIDRFSAGNDQTLIGFAVMGGVFGEGIDLVGDRLTGAVVVGVGLPGIDPERELIREYFSRQDKGFQFAYQYPGINRVLQAAGRVIRTENDRGVILLIDDRFNQLGYRRLLPSYWQIVSISSTGQLQNALIKFWNKT